MPQSPPLISMPGGEITLKDARTSSTRTVTLFSFQLATTPLTGDSALPLHAITWFDAVALCNEASRTERLDAAYEVRGREVRWLPERDGYRLPTEAEWEWACRAGTTTPRYGPLESIGWTASDGVEGPQPVALKEPNSWGLFDMIGNVWEWCWDYADPARYADYRSLRGGGWADPEWSARASVRRGSAPDAVLEDVGLRVARGAVGGSGARAAQGWSADADEARAAISGPIPVGWTPLGHRQRV